MTTIVKFTGFQQLDATALASAVGLTPVAHSVTGEKPNGALMTSYTGNVRWRPDGTSPTASVGIRMAAGNTPFLYTGSLEKFKAILEGGSPTLDVAYCVVTR